MFLKRYLRDQSGATAVEFSLLATPFFLMVIGLIEMSLMFTAQSLLEGSTASAARLIRTGQIQTGGGDPEDTFRTAVCDMASILMECDDLQFQVQNMGSFGDAGDFPDAEFDEDGNLQDQTFTPGADNDVVLIRVAYRYPITTPMMQPLLTNNSDNSRLLVSTMVIQTEPYVF